jgi:hypothetical protein
VSERVGNGSESTRDADQLLFTATANAIVYHRAVADEHATSPELFIEAAASDFSGEVLARLRGELEACPDIAFAHLCRVTVPRHGGGAQPSLFVWLVPPAVGSLRAALNLVSEAVARSLPEDRFVDVLILNSAPELLAQVEEAGGLLVERDAGERQRALAACS